jgi:hypothetical protein
MLALPFGVSLIQAYLYCIIDAKGIMEFNNAIEAILNDYVDLEKSTYIAFSNASEFKNKGMMEIHMHSRSNYEQNHTVIRKM